MEPSLPAFRLQFMVLGADVVVHLLFVGLHCGHEVGVGRRQNLNSQKSRIGRPVDRNGGNRNPRRHLEYGQERVPPIDRIDERTGTPMTGNGVEAANMPGK